MKGMPRLLVISFNLPAVSSAIDWVSTTHGPAIKNSGRSRPTSKPQRFTRYLHEAGGEMGFHPRWTDPSYAAPTLTLPRECRRELIRTRSSRRHLLQRRSCACLAERQRRFDERLEQRMAAARRRREFRVKLDADEER